VLKGELRSQVTLERCSDQQLALGYHSAFIHPGAETEIPSFSIYLTEYEAFPPFGENIKLRDAPSDVAEARVCQEQGLLPDGRIKISTVVWTVISSTFSKGKGWLQHVFSPMMNQKIFPGVDLGFLIHSSDNISS
jgi:hypothetical protein